MKVLVAESVAQEGIDLIAAHHEVDERIGCTPRRAGRHPARVRRADRPQPGRGRRRPDRRPAPGSSSSGVPGSVSTTSTSKRPRGPASRSSTPRPATRSRPPSTPWRLLYGVARKTAAADASLRRGEWKRSRVHRSGAARADARDHRARQDRPGDRRPRSGHGDGRPRRRPVRDPGTGGQPRRRAHGHGDAPGPRRRDHGPRPADPGDPQPDRQGRDRSDASGLDHHQRGAGRDRRRGRRSPMRSHPDSSPGPASMSSSTSRRRTARCWRHRTRC